MKKRSLVRQDSCVLIPKKSPSIVFKTRQKANRSQRPSTDSSIPENPSNQCDSQLDYCLHQLNNFIVKSVPISKHCAQLIKHLLSQLTV